MILATKADIARMFFLQMSNDPSQVDIYPIYQRLSRRSMKSVICQVICITCVDALLGNWDLECVFRKA